MAGPRCPGSRQPVPPARRAYDRRSGSNDGRAGRDALFIAIALAFTVLGSGLLGNLLATSPQAMLDLLAQTGFGIYFYAIHGLFEWVLMPALVILHWRSPTAALAGPGGRGHVLRRRVRRVFSCSSVRPCPLSGGHPSASAQQATRDLVGVRQ